MTKHNQAVKAITPVKFARKPFYIDAVQVTDKNMKLVAEWCQGEVRVTKRGNKDGIDEEYVKVRVHRPLNERQTQAFIGDWVLYAGSGYKVYTNKAFANSFEVVDNDSYKENTEKSEIEAKKIRDEKFAQMDLTDRIDGLLTAAKAESVVFKEA
jgi:hypothetical protein